MIKTGRARKRLSARAIAYIIMLSAAAGFYGGFMASRALDYIPVTDSYQVMSADSAPSATPVNPEQTPNSAVLLSSRDTPFNKALTIPEIASLTMDSVVEIYTEIVTGRGRRGRYITEGAGSGVIISSDGCIVTNNHVIEGAERITVRHRDGADYDAVLIGRDAVTDLAVIKIEAGGLLPAVYGDSDALVVGEPVLAIGNPLGELGGTVTDGIISALSRSIDIDGHMMLLLQTSAAVNPGNSGGGLFNERAELIGIVNAKSSGTYIEGIGFAIPINLVKAIADALIEYGYVPGRVDFGAILADSYNLRSSWMYYIQPGVYVTSADADNPLKPGDLIISIDGFEIESTIDVTVLLDSRAVGDVLKIKIARDGYYYEVEHTLKQATS